MRRIRALIVDHLWWLVLLMALALLTIHTLGLREIIVDNTSLILLALVLVSPFVAAIKKVKIGEFEAEIEPDEVSRVSRQVEKSLPGPSSDQEVAPEVSVTAVAIRNLAESDPVIALAKLRIEIEAILRRLLNRVNRKAPQGRYMALAYVIRNLTNTGLFTVEFGEALQEVVTICNRAIHGEDIRQVDAREILSKGVELLEAIEQMVRDYGITHPVETKTLTEEVLADFQNGRYRMTTIVPFVSKPELRVYELTQDELEFFFDGYSEFAESIVALERLV